MAEADKAKDGRCQAVPAGVKQSDGTDCGGFTPLQCSMVGMSALRREQARLVGERGSLVSDMAKSRARTVQIERQILQLGRQRRSKINQEAREP